MKVRLCKMIGAETVDKLVMGTFHSCVPVDSWRSAIASPS